MDFLYKYKKAFLLFGMGLCVVAIFMTTNPGYRPTFILQGLGYVIVPLQSGFTSVTNWVSGNMTLMTGGPQLQRQNAELLERIALLETENQRLRMAGAENEHLNAMFKLTQRYGELPTIGANIISRNVEAWENDFFINRGEAHGLERGMAVLGTGNTGGGLAGVVWTVYRNRAQIVPITDDRFNAAVQSIRTEDTGVIRGDISLAQSGLVRMDHISPDAQIMPGDEIMISPYSVVFPPGILIGEVLEVWPAPGGGFGQYAIVRPFADVARLESVLIVNELFAPDDEESEEE